MANTVLSELQRHTGAGGFVGSSAEQHDLTIASDLPVAAFQVLGRDLQRSRQRLGIAQHVERMTQVDNNDLLARFKLVFEFVGRDAVALDLPQKALAFAPPVKDVGDNDGHEQYQDPSAEALDVKIGAVELLAEDKPEPGVRARPQQGSQKVEEQEPWKIDADHPRQR